MPLKVEFGPETPDTSPKVPFVDVVFVTCLGLAAALVHSLHLAPLLTRVAWAYLTLETVFFVVGKFRQVSFTQSLGRVAARISCVVTERTLHWVPQLFFFNRN